MADYWMLLAQGHLSRRLFGSMLRMIAARRGRSGCWTCTVVDRDKASELLSQAAMCPA
jgi:hypothetical protein